VKRGLTLGQQGTHRSSTHPADCPPTYRPTTRRCHGNGTYSTSSPTADPRSGTTTRPAACARPRSIGEAQDERTTATPSSPRRTGSRRCPSPARPGSAVARVAVTLAAGPSPCSWPGCVAPGMHPLENWTNQREQRRTCRQWVTRQSTSHRPPGNEASSIGCPGFTCTPSTTTKPPARTIAARTWSRIGRR
jgi:hypothetical protein